MRCLRSAGPSRSLIGSRFTKTNDVLTVRLLERVRDVPREAWDALVRDESSPFVEWTWLDCLESTGCASAEHGWLPRHFAVYRGSDLVAVAPAYIKAHSEGEFVFDWAWADLAERLGVGYYPKLIFAVPFTPATGDRLLVAPGEDRDSLIGAVASAAWQLVLQANLSGAHVLFAHEAEAKTWAAHDFAPRYGIQFHWQNRGYASWEDFLATFNAKRRHQIRREVSQAEREGIQVRTWDGQPNERDVRAMFTFYKSTIEKFFYGRQYLNYAFFDAVATRFAHRLSWVFAYRNGEAMAGAFNVASATRLFGRYWGATEHVPFLHFHVCYYHGIRECIARGLQAFEPGAGGEHKLPRGFMPTVTHSAHAIAHPRLRSILLPHLARERAAVLAQVEHGPSNASE